VQNKKEPHKKNQKCGCPILPSLRTYPILPRLKLVRSGLSVLSNFTKPANLSDFTTDEIGLIWLVRFYQACELIWFYQGWKLVHFARFYQGCELVRFYQGWKLVRSCLSVLPNFTKAVNLSNFTRAKNWSDLACPFWLILPRLITCQFLPGLRTCPVFPRTENLSNSSSCLSS
jgi:hypothetical protein